MKDTVRRLRQDGKGGDCLNLTRALVAMATNAATRMVMNKQ
jgi:hypothetical protein